MDAREQRGLIIAALCKLNQTADDWLVPSQSNKEQRTYRVNIQAQTCTCPDHQEGGFKCKHIFAVEYTAKREFADGTVVEQQEFKWTEKKVYRQNWPAYNEAQSIEKDRVQEMLAQLCAGVTEPEIKRGGRRPHLLRDAIFAAAFKVYSTMSARRFASDLREAHRRGYTTVEIPGMKVVQFLENSSLTPILKSLIIESARPLRVVERDFAIDSSGFGTCRFERWYDEKYGVTRQKSVWMKCHIASGVKTNVVTAVRILDKSAADSPQFIPLVTDTARNFSIGEMSADKAYLSLDNFECVAGFGGTAFIPFKENSTGAKGGLFEKMYHYFQYRQEEFLQHYHKRSNVESTFSMVKRKFGDAVRSKSDTAMVNEVLCKFLCHNLCVLNQEQCELGIETEFWQAGEPGQLALAGKA